MKAHISIDGQFIKEIDLPVKTFLFPDRCKRAAAIFGILLASAIVSVLIPVFHFVLVPGLIIGSFVMAYLRFKEKASVDLSSLNCPECNKSLDKKSAALHENSLRLFCYECRKNIALQFPDALK